MTANFDVTGVLSGRAKESVPKNFCRKSVRFAGARPTIYGIINSFVGDGNPLRSKVAVFINVPVCVIKCMNIHIDVCAGFYCRSVRSETLATDGRIGCFLVFVEVSFGSLDTKSVIVGVSAHVQEIRVEHFFHGIHEVACMNFSAVVPFEIFTQGDFPSVAAFCFLFCSITPFCVNAGSYVFQFGSRRIVGGVTAGNDCGSVDGAVFVILAAFSCVKQIVVFEERRNDIVHNLSVVVIGVSKLIPVTRHNGRGGVISTFFQICVWDFIFFLVASSNGRNRKNQHDCYEQCDKFLFHFDTSIKF